VADSVYQRSGDNLTCDIQISLAESLLGFERSLPHPSGTVVITSNNVIRHTDVIVIEGKGMPIIDKTEQAGQLLVRCLVNAETLTEEQQKGVRLEPGEVFLTNGRVARLFNKEYDEHNGFLSIYLIKDFVYNDINFSSPYQAFEYTRLKLLKEDALADKLLTTRSVRSIRHWVREVRTLIPQIEQLWGEILKEFYTQHPDLMKKLLETKDDILAFVSKAKYLGGIGIDIDDEQRFDTSAWKNKNNIVGEALMKLRSEMLQGDEEAESKQAVEYDESVVSEEEVENKKKAAIINVMKKKESF
jgi:predicted NAD-dependent protein-ADP-ribosyltransferase YbiA (DUF1768 family)